MKYFHKEILNGNESTKRCSRSPIRRLCRCACVKMTMNTLDNLKFRIPNGNIKESGHEVVERVVQREAGDTG